MKLENQTVFNCILDGAQTIAHGIFDLIQCVSVGTLHQNGHTLGVLHILHECVPENVIREIDDFSYRDILVLANDLLVDGTGESKRGFTQIIKCIERDTTACQRQSEVVEMS